MKRVMHILTILALIPVIVAFYILMSFIFPIIFVTAHDENFIERAVILTQDRVLHPPIDGVGQVPALEVQQIPKLTGTLMEVEREHILLALRDADWVVGGLHGAAHRL